MKCASFLLKLLLVLSFFIAVLCQTLPPRGRPQPRGRSGRNFTVSFRKRPPPPTPPPFEPIGRVPGPGIALPEINNAAIAPSIEASFIVPDLGESLEEDEEPLAHCSDEVPECIDFFAQRFPTANGECNNRVNPRQGAIERSYKRYLPAQYNDRFDTLRKAVNGKTLPSARNISNLIQGELDTDTPFTQMLPFWGQFLVHDMALTLEPEASAIPCICGVDVSIISGPECINIPIPPDDPQFLANPQNPKTCFVMERSVGVANSENCDSAVRQSLNELSGYLDMGIVYGNSEEHLEAIRNLQPTRRGELIEVRSTTRGVGILLPSSDFSNQITPAANAIFCPPLVRKPPITTCRVSGEARTNENSVLQSHHTVWMRLHNIVVRQLRSLNPTWDSDRLLQVGRLIVTALHQRVTYKHFLPSIIGDQLMKRFNLNLQEDGYYYGYDSSYSAGIATSFSTAAFRMGHTLINERLTRLDRSFNSPQADPVRVRASLFNVGVVTERDSGGVSSFIRGLANESAIRFDPTVSDDLRNFLDAPNFAPSGTVFGADLLARNIQRGRDHGIPTYSQARVFCGFPALRTFRDLRGLMTPARRSRLEEIYSNVRDIDLFVGGISETATKGGVVGPTFACLIAYQFRDVKKGDRFWHENPPPVGSFTPEQLLQLRKIPFARILCEVSEGTLSMQPMPLKKPGPDNTRQICSSYPRLDLSSFRASQRTEFLQNVSQSIQKTTWFPTSVNVIGDPFTVSELYQWLRIFRPGEVCDQVIDTEIRTVRGREQVRFHCLPGTIKHSDFPPVLSSTFFWSRWFTSSLRGGSVRITPRTSRSVCAVRYAIQAQTVGSRSIPAGETGDVFNRFSPSDGLVCLGRDQSSRRCNRYRIRFLCRRR